jgi:hypothetical protein
MLSNKKLVKNSKIKRERMDKNIIF